MDGSFYSVMMLVVVVGGFLVMNSLAGRDRRLPPFSTPEGKRARLIVGIILVLIISTYFFDYKSGRLDDEGEIRRMILGVIAGAGVVLYPLLLRWRKDKRDK